MVKITSDSITIIYLKINLDFWSSSYEALTKVIFNIYSDLILLENTTTCSFLLVGVGTVFSDCVIPWH